LHFRRAPGFERLSHVEYSKLLRDKVAAAEEKAAAERREKGIKLLGRRGVLPLPSARKRSGAHVCYPSRNARADMMSGLSPGRSGSPAPRYQAQHRCGAI
jgi:hypothetical protein